MPKGKSARVGKKANKARLGTGLAAKAKRDLNSRRARVDAAVEEAQALRVEKLRKGDLERIGTNEQGENIYMRQTTDSNN